jgi:hypothetical protein
LKIRGEIDPLKQGSSVMTAIELKRLGLIFNTKSIVAKPEISIGTLSSVNTKLHYIENFYDYLSSNMNAREQDFLTNTAIEASRIVYQPVTLLRPPTA